jgi:hypothetical protein
LEGKSLPRSEFGHKATPSHGYREALAHPQRHGAYIRRNTDTINERLRQRGESPIGEGPRGRRFTRETYNDPAIPDDRTWTRVITKAEAGTKSGVPTGFHSGIDAYDNLKAAQDKARETGAPPGAVLIVDFGPRVRGGRYLLVFDDESGNVKRKSYNRNANQQRVAIARRIAIQRKRAARAA